MRTDEIEARLKAATPGPWDDKITAVYKVNTAIRICGDFHDFKRDAFFIANAPSDIAYLLSENKRLTAERNAAIAEIPKVCDFCKHKDFCNSPDYGDDDSECPCEDPDSHDNFEWRGVKPHKEENNASNVTR